MMKSLKDKFQKLRFLYKNGGISGVTFVLFYKASNKLNKLIMLEAMLLPKESGNQKYLKLPEGFEALFLSPEQAKEFSKNPKNDLDPEFLKAAFEKGDECFAIVKDGQLANYGWYSKKPTLVESGLYLHFNSSWVYMYKGFTSVDFRGLRLHGISTILAIEALAQKDKNFLGLVTYVESNNLVSRKSAGRMGYQEVGTIYMTNWFGKMKIFNKVNCPSSEVHVSKSATSENGML